jgi:DNA-binding MarR family transcriptional regulator
MGNRAQFGALAGKLVRALSRLEREQVCCGDLTFQQFQTLRSIEEAGRVNLSSLSAALGIDQSTASRNLARLERDGYLSKARHDGDARSIVVELTRQGRSALATLCCDERDTFAGIYERIPAGQRASVLASLAVIAQAIPPDDAATCCAPEPQRKLGRFLEAGVDRQDR